MAKQQRLVSLGILLTAFLVIGWLLMTQADSPRETAARKRLDEMLGQAQPFPEASPELPPVHTPGPDPMSGTSPQIDPFKDFFSVGPFSFSLPNLSGLKVEEIPEAYIVRIPMPEAADAKNVQVRVAPFHVKIAGETRLPGSRATSSFMQSFSVNQEVLPDKVSRKTENGALVITIPKKTPGSINSPSRPLNQPLPDENFVPQASSPYGVI